jgi:phage-related protein
LKPVVFLGNSLEELRSFPQDARRDAGFQIDRIQRGLDPDSWKPMSGIGPGVRELRIRGDSGAFRVIYVASFAEAIYVLHAFQKKTQRTPARMIDLAKERLGALKRGFSR